ncbi:MAG: hypothetical protein WAU70_06905 [Flavobacteriales bacterium]
MKTLKVALLLAVLHAPALQANGQCNPGNIGWLSKMLRIKHQFTRPANITYTTKPSSVYEIPFHLVVYSSLVKAGGQPYFYLWMEHQQFEVPLDIKEGAPLVFHLSNGSTLSAASLALYPGIKGQSLAFYPLDDTTLTGLASTEVDSITVTARPQGSAQEKVIVLRFSERNKNRIKEWSGCLKNELRGELFRRRVGYWS